MHNRLSVRAFAPFALVFVAAGVACSAPGSDGGKKVTPPPTQVEEQDAAPPGPLSLPFLLSDEFAPSGFMGDSEADFKAVAMSKDIADCKAPRSPDAAGDCYLVTWSPVIATGAPSAWVGVYWQYPANNWGAKTGKTVKSGAQKVSFYAAGAAGGEKIHFAVGGVNTKGGGDPSLTNKDSFTAELDVVLTTEWTKYSIPLSGAAYDTVIGGFAWVATTTTPDPIKFYLDDIRWEP
jgi:hypothetical protein